MRILYITTIGATMAFFEHFIKELLDLGHTVDIATNDTQRKVPSCYEHWDCKIHTLSFSRSPLSLDNFRAIGQLKRVIEKGNYDMVHCHTPNASMITRLVCRKLRKKNGLKVFYTAHGFHFYKGAPNLNWMVYYPIEKFCSRFTDKLITINKEDFELAKNKFRAKEIHYVPGMGIELSRFENIEVDRAAKRKEIGVPADAFLLLSVGELNENKNHQVIIKALARLNDSSVHYVIAGRGNNREYLIELASELGVSGQVHLIGYRNDIPELNCISDVFCFPSLREGLGLAAIEAMACGLPLLTSNVHGINDYSIDGKTGFKYSPFDIEGFMNGILILYRDRTLHHDISLNNIQTAKTYRIEQILLKLRRIYELSN